MTTGETESPEARRILLRFIEGSRRFIRTETRLEAAVSSLSHGPRTSSRLVPGSRSAPGTGRGLDRLRTKASVLDTTGMRVAPMRCDDLTISSRAANHSRARYAVPKTPAEATMPIMPPMRAATGQLANPLKPLRK